MEVKQKVFNENNGNWLILSPYINIYRSGQGCLLLVRTDREGRILMSANDERLLLELLHQLANGMPENELLEYLHATGTKNGMEWVDICRKEGILE